MFAHQHLFPSSRLQLWRTGCHNMFILHNCVSFSLVSLTMSLDFSVWKVSHFNNLNFLLTVFVIGMCVFTFALYMCQALKMTFQVM